jgi:hypothetical protein
MRAIWWQSRICVGLVAALLASAGFPSSQAIQKAKERTKTMSKELKEAGNQLTEFQKTKEPNYLQAAVEAMEDVDLSALAKALGPIEARRQAAKVWLDVLTAIDRSLDPNFNPDDVPERGVIPPPSNGAQFPPGADPKAIKDPAARAEYEAALRENRRKAEQYRLQTKLRRLDPHASTDVENFLTRYYTASTADQEELDGILSEAKLSLPRKQKLKALFEKESPQTLNRGTNRKCC